MLIYSSKLRFFACFRLASAASATFFNGLSDAWSLPSQLSTQAVKTGFN